MTAFDKTVSIWATCYTCRDYTERRIDSIAPPLADKAEREGREVIDVVNEFMLAAHKRHLGGQPLREGGPTRVTDPELGRLAAMMSPGLFGGFPDKDDDA